MQHKEQLKATEEGKLKDVKDKNYLFHAIERSIIGEILKDMAKEIWDAKKQCYQGSTRVKRPQLQALRKEYEMLHMKYGESMDNFFSRTLTVVNKMKAHGERMEQLMVVENFIFSINSMFDYVVCSI